MGASASILTENFRTKETEKKFKFIKSILEQIVFEILDAAVPSIKLLDFQVFRSFDSFPSFNHLVHANQPYYKRLLGDATLGCDHSTSPTKSICSKNPADYCSFLLCA